MSDDRQIIQLGSTWTLGIIIGIVIFLAAYGAVSLWMDFN